MNHLGGIHRAILLDQTPWFVDAEAGLWMKLKLIWKIHRGEIRLLFISLRRDSHGKQIIIFSFIPLLRGHNWDLTRILHNVLDCCRVVLWTLVWLHNDWRSLWRRYLHILLSLVDLVICLKILGNSSMSISSLLSVITTRINTQNPGKYNKGHLHFSGRSNIPWNPPWLIYLVVWQRHQALV